MESQNNQYRVDIGELNKIREREASVKLECQNEISNLDNKNKNLENDYKNLSEDLNHYIKNNHKLSDDLEKMIRDFELLKKHCMLLTEQNTEVNFFIKFLKKMMEELSTIADEEDRIRAHLNRNEIFDEVLRNNEKTIERAKKSLLDDSGSKGRK